MMSKRRLDTTQKGQTLLEVIVAIGLILVLTTGLLGGLLVTTRSALHTRAKTTAINLTRDKLEEIATNLKENPETNPCQGFPTTATVNNISYQITCQTQTALGLLKVLITTIWREGAKEFQVQLSQLFAQ